MAVILSTIFGMAICHSNHRVWT